MAATNDLIPDFDDFERYYSGEMPPIEQRSLEGRMLAEPLVAEAYEGFLAWRAQHASTATLRADLHERLHTRVTSKCEKVLPAWAYASAASVLLAIFSYWFVVFRDHEVARQKPAVAANAEEAKSAKPDPASASITIQPSKPLEFVVPAQKPKVSVPAASPEAGQTNNTQPALPKPEIALAPTVLADADVREDIVGNGQYSVPAGKEVAQVPPEPAKALVAPGATEGVGKSIEGRVRMEASSLHTVAKDNEAGDTQILGESITIASSKSAQKKMSKSYPIVPDTPAPVPADGWPAYRAYLEKNTGAASTTGQVVVTFIVNSSGALSGFKAKGPEELQKEAIRIISSGPAWVPARTKGVPVASLAEIQLQFRQPQ